MPLNQTIFDAHARVDGMPAADLENLAYFGVGALVTVSHDGFAGQRARDIERFFEDLVQRTVPAIRSVGIDGYAAIGIPPAKIPWRGFESLLAKLPSWLGLSEVAALGLVGLHAGGDREEDAFGRQVELARDLRVPLVVGLPVDGAGGGGRRTLSVLKEAEISPDEVLLVGATERVVLVARSLGYNVTLGSLGADEAAELVRRRGPEGLMLSSDLGGGRTDPLVPARTVTAMERLELSRAVIKRVAFENAAAFYRKAG